MIRPFFLVFVLMATGAVIAPCHGQVAVRTLHPTRPTVQFSRAGGLSVSPDGRLFISDRDRNTVLVYSPDGVLLHTLGGPGTGEGQFDDPVDVDAGIGLVISIADRQNGRIQRFSKDFSFIESLPVNAPADAFQDGDNPSFRAGNAEMQMLANGLPIAVTTSNSDELYVVDEQLHAVQRWDRERRSRWIIGADPTDPGALEHPVDVLTTATFLFVADAGCECVVVYDVFGTFIRRIAEDRLREIRKLSQTPEGFLVVMSNRLVEFTPDGTRLREIEVRLDSELVDAGRTRTSFLLLTEKELFFVSI